MEQIAIEGEGFLRLLSFGLDLLTLRTARLGSKKLIRTGCFSTRALPEIDRSSMISSPDFADRLTSVRSDFRDPDEQRFFILAAAPSTGSSMTIA